MKNWLVVANAARARLLEETDQPGAYRHRADMVHPQSRQKGRDLSSDRAGHIIGASNGPGGAAYMPRTDVREHEQDHFARQLAAVLDAAVASGECAGIVLVASNPFLGHLKGHLDTRTRAAILRTVPSDYTALRDVDIAQRLRETSASS